MASNNANGVRLHQAQKKALGIVLNRATPERRTKIRTALVTEEALPSVGSPLELAAFHMDLIAGLAEIVEAQHVRIARLENPPVAAAAAAADAENPPAKGTKKRSGKEV